MKLIVERQIFIVESFQSLPSRQKLLAQIPVPQNGRMQWPLRSDLDGLSDKQLQEFALTEF
jgi:hypothetical protein